MAKYTLSESFSISGDWHLPSDATRVVAGELQYSPKGSELLLHNTFRPVTSGNDQDTEVDYPVVHGVTTAGEAITLLNAIKSGGTWSMGAAGFRQTEKLLSSWLLIGTHANADTTYPEVSFRVPGLHIWLSRALVQQSYGKGAEGEGNFHSFRILPLQQEAVRIPSLDATICFKPAYTTSADQFSISVQSHAWVAFRPDAPQPLKWYLEQHGRLAPLLAFLGGSPMSADRIEAKVVGSRGSVTVQVSMRDVHYCTHKSLAEFFMPRDTLGVDLSVLLNNWFNLNEKVRTPSQLALSVLGSEGLWLHVEFLSLMQALEGFHRGLYSGTYMADEPYEDVKRKLSSAIPSDIGADHRASLASRIRYGNQISLAKRLNELVSRLPRAVCTTVLGVEGKIPRSWIDTRNYHTHWDEELRQNVIDGQRMHHANTRMRNLLRVLYLHHVGVSESALLAALTNSSKPSQKLAYINATEARRRGE